MSRHRLLVALLATCLVGIAVVVGRLLADGAAPATATPGESGSSQVGPSRGVPRGVPSNAERVTVTKHVDGDTIRVRASASDLLRAGEDVAVRLLEIDTPESVDPTSPVECYARQASRSLAALLPVGADAWATADKDLMDPYDRFLLYLWTSDGTFVNLEMVASGNARAVLYEPNDAYIDSLRLAEREARAAGRGLWGACEYFGQPRGVSTGAQTPASTSGHADGGTDPRFDTCAAAASAGFSDYRRGRDQEYGWYDDADGDGVVCEL